MKKIFTHILALLAFSAAGQNLDLQLNGEKNCDEGTYCVTLAVQATSGSFELGTSSLLLTYDWQVLKFREHVPLNFAAGASCGGNWLAQKIDAHSHPGQLELTLTLAEDGTSCPPVSEMAAVNVSTVCFDILLQGGVPAVKFEMENTQFNSDHPDDGSAAITVASVEEIISENLLACDCPGEGTACDDQNVYTVNDRFDLNCNCRGEYLDSDEDGILDGIDACLDQNYEAENALLTSVNVLNNQPQFSGLGFADYNSNNNDAVEFTVTVNEPGEHQLAFRYALEEGNRPMELTIDGMVISDTFDFPASGAWSDWDTVYHNFDFTVGEHSIALTTNGSNGPNLDLLIFSTCTDCQMSAMPCDDGDPCTTEDVFDANCNCGGKYLDDDDDGVCNPLDLCAGANDNLDTDGDGLPDGCDDCDNGLIGTPCDDGDPCTIDDVIGNDCSCHGVATAPDSDGDGVCDTYDVCPAGNDLDDVDGDGIPDACDPCDDRTIGSPCDDGDPCTLLDMVQSDCNCAGIFFDSDGDGICNALDACPDFDDLVDNDGDGIPDACDPSVAISNKMEVGKADGVGEEWRLIELDNDYTSPVIVATVQLISTDMPPVVTRIRNAGAGSFELRIQNPGGTTEELYDVQYFVVEEGIYTQAADGLKMEAQRVLSTETGGSNTGFIREERAYLQAYSQPVVLGQVMTQNDDRWSVFWQSRDNSQSNPADSLRFAAGKHVGEDTITIRTDETLGLIVFEAGNFALDGVRFETFVGEDIVEDAIGNTGFIYPLELSASNRAVVSQAGMDGGDGSWPLLFGNDPFRPNALIVATDEDQIVDTDRYHTAEQLAYVAFEFTGAFSLQILASENECNGAALATATAAPLGGEPPYNYLWSNGETTPQIEDLTAGIYAVTVTDELGTALTSTVTVVEPPAIELTVEGSEVDCFGNENGTATAFAEGGTGALNYNWDTGSTEMELTNLAPGLYTVTVTDGNGCLAQASATVQSQSPLEVEVAGTDVACFGMATASATATSNGGAGATSWLWENGATTPTIDNLSVGTYAVTATDGNGCVTVSSIEIFEPPLLEIEAAGTDVACFGNATGTASADSEGGTGGLSWLWENGETTSSIENLPAGNYGLTATDDNGCTAISAVEISQPDEFLLQANADNITCNGLEDGIVIASYSGGNDGVTYVWSNGATSEIIENLSAGEYSVTATDALGCEAIAMANLSEPDMLSLSGNAENVSCFGGTDGEASATAVGGAGGITYLWSDGQVGEVATDLMAGAYTVTATDGNGCSLIGNFDIDEPELLEANATDSDVSCFGGNDGVGTVTADGGTGNVTFEWSNGSIGPLAPSLAPGEYTVTATDANGCTAVSSIEITQPTVLNIIVEDVVAATYSNSDGGASITVSGGADNYTFEWILDGDVVSDLEDPTNLPAGEYTLQVTDGNGCVRTEIVIIESLTSAAERALAAVISIQPNPTSGAFSLTVDLPTAMDLSVSILDASGKIVQQQILLSQSADFNLSGYAAGVYFLKIKNGEAVVTKRVVITCKR